MSPKDESNPLDQLLIRCAESRAPSDEHLELLTNRIQRELRNHVAPKQSFTHRSFRTWAGILATAASIIIALTVWKYAATPLSQVVVKQNEAGLPQSSTTAFVSRQTALFGQLQSVFDQRLAWVAESSQDVLFEIESDAIETKGPLMCIRLALATKPIEATTAEGQKVWELDVIVRSEQTVRIGGIASSPELVLWPFVTDDGKVLVESQFNLPTPLGFQHSQTTLLSPDEQAEQGVLDPNYVLSQSVVLLKEPAI